SGTMTTSHLRFGPEPVEAPYLVKNAQFVGVHQFSFLERYDVLKLAAPGAVVLLNSTSSPEHLWDHLPRTVQEAMVAKGLQLYVIDAYAVARELGLGARINTIMQTCFFAISGVLPEAEAIEKIKAAIVKTYSRKGQKVVDSNMAAVDAAVGHLHRVDYPDAVTAPVAIDGRWDEAPDFVRNVTRVILANEGDRLPVSAFPIDGTWLTGTTKYEKRNVAQEIPVWTTELCIQCNKCAAVCPHAAIRAKFYPESALAERPETFQSMAFKSRENPHHAFTIQVAPEDCTGCRLCVEVCPGKDRKDPTRKALTMAPQEPLREAEAENFDFFQALPQPKPTELGNTIKDSQFREPLFEFSGACAGCGETPYLKLLTQLYGDRLLIANATGCSSIYGGNLPTTPYSQNADGRGPAWANSLFEDNAEFGLGMRLAVDQREAIAKRLLRHLLPRIYPGLGRELLEADQSTDTGIAMQRERVKILREWLGGIDEPAARELEKVADYLVKKIVWIVGGDGWAYDIGYGGLDHVISSGKNVNILVLDTEVYSNTGGQASKSTSLGAIAKFAAAGKGGPKKSLGLLAMSYGNVYVAKVAMGAKDTQTLNALQEAVAFDGPSLVIAYSHCIAHGFDLAHGMDHQKMAVDTGYWPIYRYDPRRALQGETPLKLDCRKPKLPLSDFAQSEVRYRLLQLQNPGRAKELCNLAQEHVSRQFDWYEQLAALKPPSLKKE
ncbi:MAG: pyruvate:ferredoxin (flavodoxin) oxidoreductase, partial [Opitutales bacterium]